MNVDPWVSVDQVETVCASCAESMRRKGIRAIRASVLRASIRTAQWEKLPKGWTQGSLEDFWKTLTGSVKHKVTKCIEKMKGTEIDDPGAFCASLADKIEGKGWRSERESRIVERIVAKYPDSAPTEEDRKLWREQAEKRRRKEGIRPRKAMNVSGLLSDLRSAYTAISRCRVRVLTNSFRSDDLRDVLNDAKHILDEVKKLVGVCEWDMDQSFAAGSQG